MGIKKEKLADILPELTNMFSANNINDIECEMCALKLQTLIYKLH